MKKGTKQRNVAMILWTYPREDWQEAVKMGITDFASYHEYLNRKRDILRFAKQQGMAVFDFSMPIKDYEAEMQRRGLGDITNGRDRAKATYTIGVELLRGLAASA